jgi:tRNA A-37 threonylcarbamoyl transferase component Bud32
MKEFRIKDMKWFLEDEGLSAILERLPEVTDARRHYVAVPYKDGKLFIKTFVEKGAVGALRNRTIPRGRKEYETGKRLASMAIRTPGCLGYGVGRNRSCVIQDWIDGEGFVHVFFRHGYRERLIPALAELLKRLKEKGVCHNDLHLDNVLVSGDELYLIDLHKTKMKNTLGDNDELSNLTHALTMIYEDLSEKEKAHFFELYGNTGIQKAVEGEIIRLRKKWIESKKKRAFQETSKIVRRAERLYIAGMEDHGRGAFVETLKSDRKVRVERYSDHIRKIYKGRRRLERAWRNHIVLLYLNAAIIPLAYYVKLPSLFSDGFIAMEDLGSQGRELDRHLDGFYDDMDISRRRRFIDAFSGFMKRVIAQGIAHNDMKGCNIFVVNNDQFFFLDVEDIAFGDIDEAVLLRMFVQLNNTIPKRISVSDRLRFFARLTESLNIDRKRVLKKVVEESLKGEIVYEGVSGLKEEKW